MPKKQRAPQIPVDYQSELRHGADTSQYEAVVRAIEENPADLDALLTGMHPADIANIIERLPREERAVVVRHLPQDWVGEVISELDEGVRENVLSLLPASEVQEALEDLESDDAADIARTLEEISEEDAIPLRDHQQKRLLNYDEETAGGLMQLEVLTAPPRQTVGETLAYIRDNEDELPYKPGTVFVVTPQRKLLGTVSISRLVKVPLTASLADVMRLDPLVITPDANHAEVLAIFEKYDIHNLAVVNKRGQLLGRITIDDVLDMVLADAARQQARAVGLDEEEDLFAPAQETARHRLPWLFINLLTAVAAASVIALFEDSIAKLTTLAVLMPIVASMGGNATTQTQTVIIRALALGQITRQNAFELLKKEFLSGGYLGLIMALLMALGTWLLFGSPMLALVIALATVANHLVAALGGWLTPIVLKRFNYDPAISTGVITTTFTDVGGFFVFLGLATLLLL